MIKLYGLLVVLVCFAVLAISAFAAMPRPAIDTFAIWGQSNAQGSSTETSDAVTTPDSETGLSAFSFRSRIPGRAWSWANDWPCSQEVGDTECGVTTRQRASSAGPPDYSTCPDIEAGTDINATTHANCRTSQWPSFARAWMRDRNRSVYFVASAQGQTCLVAPDSANEPAWDVDITVDTWEDHDDWTGPSTGNPGDLLAQAILAIELSASSGSLRAVFWDQGECDAGESVAEADYEAALETLADIVWERFRVPVLVSPIPLESSTAGPGGIGFLAGGEACTRNSADSDLMAIREAQLDAIADHAHIYMGANKDDLIVEADCSHTHEAGELGRRWFAAAQAAGL